MSEETSKITIVFRKDSCFADKCAFQKGHRLINSTRYRGALMGPHNMANAEHFSFM